MSGISGLFNQDGSPTIDADMLRRSCVLARPGPDGTTIGPFGQAALGHALFATEVFSGAVLPAGHDAVGARFAGVD